MLSQNNKIFVRQLQILLILNIAGMGVIALPRTVVAYAGCGGWINIVFAIVLVSAYTYLICKLNKNIDKPINKFIRVLFLFKLVLVAAMDIRIFSELVQKTVLETVPVYVVSAVIISVSVYAAVKGYETQARVGEILILLMIFMFGIIIFTSFDVEYCNLLPVNHDSINKNALLESLIAFSGFELAFLALPCINGERKKKIRGITVAVLITGFLIFYLTMIIIARFGNLVTKQQWPLLDFLDSSAVPGTGVDRHGALMFSFFIISIFAVTSASFIFSRLILKDVLKKLKGSAVITVFLAAAVFFLSILPKTAVSGGMSGIISAMSMKLPKWYP